MNPRKPPSPGDANEEVSALIEVLHETGQRLEELTAGEVDAVADRHGRTVLLRRAQDHFRHTEAAKQYAILNALPAHIALLDAQGIIISVNEAWRGFACVDVAQGAGHEIGRNYLEICANASGEGSSEAHRIAEGIRSVLGGEAKSFSVEYPSHSPAEQRWFLLTVTPLAAARPNGAVVMHLNITERKRTEVALAHSEAGLHRAQLMAKLGHVITRPDGSFQRWSESLPQLIGVEPAQLPRTTRAWLEILHPDDRALFRDKAIEAGAKKLRVELEYRLRKATGQWIHMRQTMEPLNQGDAPGGLRWFNTLQDVTAERQIEESLRVSESRFRQMADNIRDVFFLQNLDSSQIYYVSPAYEQIWGRTCESLYAKPASWAEAIHPDDLQHAFAAFSEGRDTGFDYEFRIVRPDGAMRWIHVRGFPILDGAGNAYRTAGVASDITQRKLAHVELEQTHKLLLEASRRDGMAEVATNVLHNVGNVLNSVNVSASLVAENLKSSRAAGIAKVATLLREQEADLGSYITSDPKGQHIPAFLEQVAKDWLAQQQAVAKELESLRANIDHIKEIVAMQQSHAKVLGSAEFVNVSDLVEDSLRMNADDLIKHEVEIVREFEEVPPISVEKHKVLQILINLVRNAKHACNELGGAKRMTLRIAQVGGRVRISVSDNGAGIAPEHLARIFARGFTTRKDGHGFGLHSGALAAVELGGSLSAKSEGLGKGATFTLELARHSPAVAA